MDKLERVIREEIEKEKKKGSAYSFKKAEELENFLKRANRES